MSQILITEPIFKRQDTQAISIERANMLREMRRRRVAKRKLKKVPLFAVEEMQTEFPGYTYDDFVADVTRKSRKGKSFRRPKKKAFDWPRIYEELPDLVGKMFNRKPTSFCLKMKVKANNGDHILLIVKVNSIYYGEYGEGKLRTETLIKLLKGNSKDFLNHPAVLFFEQNNNLNNT
ncbi:hypothetical protein EKK58_12575 [Candidatus Dependentiae bacterium]|nr:MAG: hypothetical protein EKK58_12575 [Candidatus Dependentiae bacterium]